MSDKCFITYPFFRSYSSTSSSNPSSSHYNQPPTALHPLEDVERASSKMSSSSNESTNSNSIEIDRRSLGEPYFQNVKFSNIQQGFFSISSIETSFRPIYKYSMSILN